MFVSKLWENIWALKAADLSREPTVGTDIRNIAIMAQSKKKDFEKPKSFTNSFQTGAIGILYRNLGPFFNIGRYLVFNNGFASMRLPIKQDSTLALKPKSLASVLFCLLVDTEFGVVHLEFWIEHIHRIILKIFHRSKFWIRLWDFGILDLSYVIRNRRFRPS